jgi:hypothetical protein
MSIYANRTLEFCQQVRETSLLMSGMIFDLPILIIPRRESAQVCVPIKQGLPVFNFVRLDPEIGDTIITVPMEDVNMFGVD